MNCKKLLYLLAVLFATFAIILPAVVLADDQAPPARLPDGQVVQRSTWGAIKVLYRNDGKIRDVGEYRTRPSDGDIHAVGPSIITEVVDDGGRERFRLTVSSTRPELLQSIKPEQFHIKVDYGDPIVLGPPWKSEAPSSSSSPHGATTDAPVISGDKVFVDVLYLGSFGEHRRIRNVTVTTSPMPSEDSASQIGRSSSSWVPCASICYVYTYVFLEVKSVVVRANPCGGGTAYFFHRHCSGCPTHWFFTSSFTSCTYAYDCYPWHSINQVTVCGYVPTYGSGWDVTFYVWNCYGRC